MFCGSKLLVILMVKKLSEHFIKKNCKKTNQRYIWIEKVVKNKGDKLYVEWKDCGNSFNSWMDKKRYCYMKWVIFHIPIAKTKKKICWIRFV